MASRCRSRCRAPFQAGIAAYVAMAVAYSLWLKAFVLVDVFTLAGLYAVRILAGAAAIAVPVSHWLLVFSLFMFLSLALAKRYAESRASLAWNAPARRDAVTSSRTARWWVSRESSARAGLCALVFALYITSPEVRALYTRPLLLWIACPILLYWVARVTAPRLSRRARRGPAGLRAARSGEPGVRVRDACGGRRGDVSASREGTFRGAVFPRQRGRAGARDASARRIAAQRGAAPARAVAGGATATAASTRAAPSSIRRGLDRLIAFDRVNGIVRCEAGATVERILDAIVPAGWFLPVTPGTRRVTIGGAIANDVHGKNHHRAGTFGCHVRAFELLRFGR